MAARLGLPAHRDSSRHVQAVYPFVFSRGLGGDGVYIGNEALGGAFVYDPFVLYSAIPRVLSNPNMLVVGDVGVGKSSLVKTYLYRQALFGRTAWIVDPKGEYATLASALGSSPIRLGPGSPIRLNPLDPGRVEPDRAEGRRHRAALVAALGATVLGRSLSPQENAACDHALARLETGGQAATLPRVAEAVLWPDDADAHQLNTTPADHATATRDLGLALRQLCAGHLAGVFDDTTTPGLDLTGPCVVLDLSGMRDSQAAGLLMLCATRWLTTALLQPDARRRLIVIDEAWRLIAEPAIARWLQATWKLCRAYGAANVAVLHRVTDIDAAGAAGSEQVAIAKGLIADCGTQVLYRQERDAVRALRQVVDLPDAVADRLPQLPAATAVWRVAGRTYEVTHRRSPAELALTNTDHAMTDNA
jgi:type IV secretory pathway VirB4 component